MDKILDGKKIANELNLELKNKIELLLANNKNRPRLATILVGENPASKVYVNIKHKTCANIGISSIMINL